MKKRLDRFIGYPTHPLFLKIYQNILLDSYSDGAANGLGISMSLVSGHSRISSGM